MFLVRKRSSASIIKVSSNFSSSFVIKLSVHLRWPSTAAAKTLASLRSAKKRLTKLSFEQAWSKLVDLRRLALLRLPLLKRFPIEALELKTATVAAAAAAAIVRRRPISAVATGAAVQSIGKATMRTTMKALLWQ
jgi:hypothetical protein